MELFIALFLLGYVVYKLSALASLPRPPVEPRPKKEPKPIEPKPALVPSRAQQAAAAKARYAEVTRMIDAATMDATERGAAREKARQDYLKELDGLM